MAKVNLYRIAPVNINKLDKQQITNALGNFYYFISNKTEAFNFISKNQKYYLESFDKNDNLLRQKGYQFILQQISSNSKKLINPNHLDNNICYKALSVIPSRENLPSFWLSKLCQAVPFVVLSVSKKRYNSYRLAEITCVLKDKNKKALKKQIKELKKEFITFHFQNNKIKHIPCPIKTKRNLADFTRGAFQISSYDLCGSFMFSNKNGLQQTTPTWHKFALPRLYKTVGYFQKPKLDEVERRLEHL